MGIDIERLARYITERFPGKPFSVFLSLDVNSTIIKELSLFVFKNSKYQSRYSITKVFRRNTGKIDQYFRQDEAPILGASSFKNRDGSCEFYDIKRLKEIISKLNISTDHLKLSCYSAASVHGSICQHLNLKNNLKNRMKIKQRWSRYQLSHGLDTKQTQENAISDGVTKCCDSTPTKIVASDFPENKECLRPVGDDDTIFFSNEYVPTQENTISDDIMKCCDSTPTKTVASDVSENKERLSPVGDDNNIFISNEYVPTPIKTISDTTNSIIISDDTENIAEFCNSTPLKNVPLTKEVFEMCSPVMQSSEDVRAVKVRKNIVREEISFEASSEDERNVSRSSVYIPSPIKKIHDKTQKETFVLPLGAKNLDSPSQNLGTKFGRQYCEGTFLIYEEEWRHIFKAGKLHPKYYPYVLKEKFKSVNNVCVINFKSWRINKKCFSVIVYAYCAHSRCKRFILNIKQKANTFPLQVEVYSTSKNYNHEQKLTRHVKGVERALFHKDLKVKKPLLYRNQCISNASVLAVKRGNYEQIKSYPTLRKIRSEALSFNDRHDDDLLNLILMRRDSSNANYIQYIGEPLTVYVFSKEQIFLLKNAVQQNTFTALHLDATGSVVRQPVTEKKRIFYYAGVVRLGDADVIPILEMISSRHTAVDIGTWLSKFKHFCLKNGLKWPIFKILVTDVSFALINAVTEFWNLLPSVVEYINICYDKVFNNAQLPQHFILLKFCCCHYIKIITKDVNNYATDKKSKCFLKEVIASAFHINHPNDLVEWFRLLVYVLCSPSTNDKVKDSVNALINICLKLQVSSVDEQFSESGAANDYELPLDSATIYKSSKFYIHFLDIYNKVTTELPIDHDNSSDDPNPYYNHLFVEVILRKYIPFLPFWSNVITTQDKSSDRFSNAPVESWFGLLKNNILSNQVNLKCSRFIRSVRSHVLAKHKEISLTIKKNRCASRKVKVAEEQWNRKKQSNKSYFKPVYLKQILSKPEEIIKLQLTQIESDKSSAKQISLRPNGTVSSDNYYSLVPGCNYTIAFYENIEYPIKELTAIDFQCLTTDNVTIMHNRWLSNFIIEISLLLFFKKLNVTIITSEMAQHFIYATDYQQNSISIFKKKYPHLENLILIPTLINNNHWCLAVIDMIKKTFAFMNPLGSSIQETVVHMTKFLKFLRRYNQKQWEAEESWNAVTVPHALQDDLYNCGIYILQFAECVVNKQSAESIQNPNEFRKYLTRYLLEQSSDVTQLCLYCGRRELNTTARWVQCDMCDRWVHQSCTPPVSADIRYSLDTQQFQCVVCTAYIQKKNKLNQ